VTPLSPPLNRLHQHSAQIGQFENLELQQRDNHRLYILNKQAESKEKAERSERKAAAANAIRRDRSTMEIDDLGKSLGIQKIIERREGVFAFLDMLLIWIRRSGNKQVCHQANSSSFS
jgi:hypothetical protein